MCGLRYFDDMIYEAIEKERRIREIEKNASNYADRCARLRFINLPRIDREPPDFHRATEGLCAVRIILATEQSR